MPDPGFLGGTYQAASISQDAQDCVNWYIETDPTKHDGERGQMALYPAPGLLLKNSTMMTAPVRGLYTIPGGSLLLAATGNKLYSIDASFAATQRGTLASSSGPVSINSNPTAAYIVDGSNRYSFVWGTNTFATISDGAFNGGTRTDILDNYLIYNDPSTQQWGATNANSTASSALSFSSKDQGSDNLVSLIVDGSQVVLMGEKTTEFWIDAGAFPFPFQRIPGTGFNHGIVAPFSVARFGESEAWLSQDGRGQNIVLMLEGYNPKRISTFAVETAIAGYSVVSDAIGYTYQQAGHEFYVLTFPTADATWVYDLSTGFWHRRAWRDSLNVMHRHRSNCCAVFQGQIIVGDYQNGKLYALSQSTFTDNGDALTCLRRARHLTSDLKRQFFASLQFQFQPGVGLQIGQGSDPQCMLRWSNDGGFTWGNYHTLKLGKAGQYKRRAIKRRMGYARDRVYEVSMTDPVYRVLVSAEMSADTGGS